MVFHPSLARIVYGVQFRSKAGHQAGKENGDMPKQASKHENTESRVSSYLFKKLSVEIGLQAQRR